METRRYLRPHALAPGMKAYVERYELKSGAVLACSEPFESGSAELKACLRAEVEQAYRHNRMLRAQRWPAQPAYQQVRIVCRGVMRSRSD